MQRRHAGARPSRGQARATRAPGAARNEHRRRPPRSGHRRTHAGGARRLGRGPGALARRLLRTARGTRPRTRRAGVRLRAHGLPGALHRPPRLGTGGTRLAGALSQRAARAGQLRELGRLRPGLRPGARALAAHEQPGRPRLDTRHDGSARTPSQRRRQLARTALEALSHLRPPASAR